jgi:hypothetical protein
VVAGADVSVFASAGVRNQYAGRYPRLADRFGTIHNGYDLDEVAAARAMASGQPGDGRFRVAFTGSLQGAAEARLLVGGLRAALEMRPDLSDRLRVQLIGWLSPAAEAVAGEALAGLAPMVERIGQQPKQTALRMLAEADAALVLLANAPGREHVPSAKLFDAIGLDRPVLAVAPEGEVRRILAELGWGIGAEPTADGFVKGLVQLLEAEPPDRPADPEGRFERRALSRRLAAYLDACAGARLT